MQARWTLFCKYFNEQKSNANTNFSPKRCQACTHPQLTNPFSTKPPFRFGTVPYTNADMVLAKNLPSMHAYMNNYNRSHPNLGILATKKG